MSRELENYRSALGSHNRGPTGLRSEIEIELAPGEQVARVRITLSRVELGAGAPVEFVRIATETVDHHVEVTDLRVSVEDVEVELVSTGDGVAILGSCKGPARTCDLTIDFLVWDAMSPADGVAPYLYSSLDLRVELVGSPGKPTLVNLMTPAESGPRSTQGNFRMAYPSALWSGKRLTRIYYTGPRVRLHYRVGANEGLTAPWLSLGRAAVSALFVFIILDIASGIDVKDRFIALIAAFVAVAGVLWELVRDAAGFSIYDAWRKRIQLLVVAGQMLLIVDMIFALIALTRTPSLRNPAALVSLLLTTLLASAAIAGLTLHSVGWWHGFVCDQVGCTSMLRRRRHRTECHYTGRVFCDEHQITICDACPHGSDARSGLLESRSLFGTVPTPCGAIDIPTPSRT